MDFEIKPAKRQRGCNIFRLVTTLHENDKKTEIEISQISLLNIALYLGMVDQANELYDSTNFNHEALVQVIL